MAIDNNYSAREVCQCIEHMSGAAAAVAGVRQIVPSNPTSREKRQAASWRSDRVSRKANLHPLTSEFLSLAAHTHMAYIFSSHSCYYYYHHHLSSPRPNLCQQSAL
jgi:hypothetical protein